MHLPHQTPSAQTIRRSERARRRAAHHNAAPNGSTANAALAGKTSAFGFDLASFLTDGQLPTPGGGNLPMPKPIEAIPGPDATANDLSNWLDANFHAFSVHRISINSPSHSPDVHQWADINFPGLPRFADLLAHPAANDALKEQFVQQFRAFRKGLGSYELIANVAHRDPAWAKKTLEEWNRRQTIFSRVPFDALLGAGHRDAIMAPL